MKIGGESNQKIKKFLIEVERISEGDTEKKIDMNVINKELNYSRSELKNILDYLDKTGCVKPRTIGGKWLYGHVSITVKGLEKAKNWN